MSEITSHEPPKPAYHRIRLDRGPAIEVRCLLPLDPNDPWARGGSWGLTIVERDGIDPSIEVRVHTDDFRVFVELPDYFRLLHERSPRTRDEAAAILDELGVVNDTAEYAKRRLQSTWGPVEDDTWPHL